MSGKRRIQRLTLGALLVVVVVFGAGVRMAYASACTINTMPYWDGNITNGWNAAAQTFMAPSSSCDVLTEYEFELAGRDSPGSVQFSIYAWSPSGPVGSALYTTTMSWGTSAQLFDITNINLTLTPGQLYGADVDFLGYTGQSLYFQYNQTGYPGGDGWWYNGSWNEYTGTNDYFLANFGSSSTPEPSSLILFGSGIVGVVGILRRKVLR